MKKRAVLYLVAAILLAVSWFFLPDNWGKQSVSLEEIPDFSGMPYVVVQDNVPDFADSDIRPVAYERYSELDILNRCGAAEACIGTELMPTEERGSIGQVKPSGWQTVKYDSVDGKYLYNRCHLIGFQLTGENANPENLITGTRYMNVEGMLPFENMVADYIRETGYHVLYRVTPVFEGDDLVARGVHMEALSVEDGGEGICFNVFVYNCQPGIHIEYATGDSWVEETVETGISPQTRYILNTGTMKFHNADCSQAESIKQSNKAYFNGNREDLIGQGYSPGKCCDS